MVTWEAEFGRGPPGHDAQYGDTGRDPEAEQPGDQDALDDAEPARSDRQDGQQAGDAVGEQEGDRIHHVSVGGQEDPQGGRVE